MSLYSASQTAAAVPKARKSPDRITFAKWCATLDEAHKRAAASLTDDERAAVEVGLRALRDLGGLAERVARAEDELAAAKKLHGDAELNIRKLGQLTEKLDRIVAVMAGGA